MTLLSSSRSCLTAHWTWSATRRCTMPQAQQLCPSRWVGLLTGCRSGLNLRLGGVEATLLALAYEFEAAHPWAGKHPPSMLADSPESRFDGRRRCANGRFKP